jgi:CRP-like cAMP-binding protein
MPRRKSPLTDESIAPHQCSTEVRLAILGKVSFFASLPPAALGVVNARFREQGFVPGETIYLAGDPAARLYVVASGQVKLLRHSLGGQDVLLDILAPGDLFGSLATLGNARYAETAQALTACCVLGVGADDFRGIVASHPDVALAVLDTLSGRLQAAHEQVRQLSAHPAEQRLAHTLLALGDKLGRAKPEGLLIAMPLSRDDLAAMTGTTAETASRVLSQFRKAGLIRSGRQWVAIVDRERLALLAAG